MRILKHEGGYVNAEMIESYGLKKRGGMVANSRLYSHGRLCLYVGQKHERRNRPEKA